MNTNSNTATQLPATHFSHRSMMSWSIENGRMSVHIEEPFGIHGLDLEMVLNLGENGLPTNSLGDIQEANAVGANDEDCKFEIELGLALDMINMTLIPSIRRDFPHIAI